MGVGISHVFASNGIPTVLVDARPSWPRRRGSASLDLLARLEAAGNVGEARRATARANLSAAASIGEAVDGADLVVEAVAERPDVKAAVYAEIEAAAADGAVIATNTSSIPIAELAAGLRRPGPLPRRALVRAAAARPVRRGDPGAVDGRPGRASRSSPR